MVDVSLYLVMNDIFDMMIHVSTVSCINLTKRMNDPIYDLFFYFFMYIYI